VLLMPVAALVVYVVWAVLAFGWRTAVQVRRTGDTGLRLHAQLGSVQWWAKLGFIVALAVGFAAPIASLSGMDDVAALDHDWLHAIGLVVAGAGALLTVAAQVAMGDSWRIGVDPEEHTGLVADGPFALVRNPIYSAMLVTAVGLTAMVPNVVALAGFVTLVAALELQVRRVEEPYLAATHGHDYAAYAARVGRFLPGLGRLA
jgi:protein-S-isoprenylcysteine O-methyltransferase Ste14